MTRPSVLSLSLAWMSWLAPDAAPNEVRLPAVFGDHMVLQRDAGNAVWGFGEPGGEVSVTASWDGAPVRARVDAGGRWTVTLKTPGAGGPHSIRVAGSNEIVLDDVMIGEVWICSGQSNMEWSINQVRRFYETDDAWEAMLATADLPRVRLFNVARQFDGVPMDDCSGRWWTCSPESVIGFSAVGFFFGRELHAELDVPIGLIGSNWGGTVAEAWTSAEALRRHGEFDDALDRIAAIEADEGSVDAEFAARKADWWNTLAAKDPASKQRLYASSSEDAAWSGTMAVPSLWEGDLDDFDGVLWMRRDVELPAAWAGRPLTLELGPIDDMDSTWFNGQKVGGAEEPGFWSTPRRYDVPAGVAVAGVNTVTVRVVDTGGAGGFSGEADAHALRDATGDAIPLAGTWRWARGAEMGELPRFPTRPGIGRNSPTALFNGMIAPLVPYGIRGAIWYQGESNRTRGRQYRTLFPAMIEDWRLRFGHLFPFYFVQIAPYGYRNDTGEAAELREAQMMTLAASPNTGMAVTMDVGDPKDIHPLDKETVAHRLARWALSRTYGRVDLVCSGPLYRSMRVSGSKVRLTFDHVGGGLVADGGALTHFTIAGEDRVFHAAAARIDGGTVVVSSPQVTRPFAVRYGWGAADEPNLRNVEKLPASSFRTDDW